MNRKVVFNWITFQAAINGRRMVKVVPRPGSDATWMVPLCSSISLPVTFRRFRAETTFRRIPTSSRHAPSSQILLSA